MTVCQHEPLLLLSRLFTQCQEKYTKLWNASLSPRNVWKLDFCCQKYCFFKSQSMRSLWRWEGRMFCFIFSHCKSVNKKVLLFWGFSLDVSHLPEEQQVWHKPILLKTFLFIQVWDQRHEDKLRTSFNKKQGFYNMIVIQYNQFQHF